jgi:ribonuclease BN (tRNA processing enzyme)
MAPNQTNPNQPKPNQTKPKQLKRDTLNHGHSTPEVAGEFAKRIKARRLVLNHFSPRYKGDNHRTSV